MNMLNYHQLINEILVAGYDENNERTAMRTLKQFKEEFTSSILKETKHDNV